MLKFWFSTAFCLHYLSENLKPNFHAKFICMKTLMTLLFLLFSVPAVFAQDLLIKKNGEEVPVKILELTPDFIKYKRSDNLDGPIISIRKQDVFMVKYANGVKEVFAPAPLTSTATTFPDRVPVAEPEAAKDPAPYQMKLGGPRFGGTFIAGGKIADRLEKDYDASPFITQFGWQFETRIFSIDEGPSGLIEFVPLIGGIDQGLFLPSASVLIGIRGDSGLELGFGPNFSAAGSGVVIAAGGNLHSGNVNFPMNFAVVPSKNGTRFSLIFGFNYRTRKG